MGGREFSSLCKFCYWVDVLTHTRLFCLTSYGLVFLLLKLRSKKTKTAKS